MHLPRPAQQAWQPRLASSEPLQRPEHQSSARGAAAEKGWRRFGGRTSLACSTVATRALSAVPQLCSSPRSASSLRRSNRISIGCIFKHCVVLIVIDIRFESPTPCCPLVEHLADAMLSYCRADAMKFPLAVVSACMRESDANAIVEKAYCPRQIGPHSPRTCKFPTHSFAECNRSGALLFVYVCVQSQTFVIMFNSALFSKRLEEGGVKQHALCTCKAPTRLVAIAALPEHQVSRLCWRCSRSRCQ